MSRAKGVPKSPEHRARISAALSGRPKSAAHREALSAPKSEAHKKALSEANLSEGVQSARRATMLENYGVDHPSKIPEMNNLSPCYWVAKGFSEEEALDKVSSHQKFASGQVINRVSHWSKSYWLNLGFSENEAIRKVSELQRENSNKSTITVSKEGSSFLDEIEKASGLFIKRETLQLGKFTVDGFVSESNVIIEYFGSFWHMHSDLFRPNDIHPVTGWRASSKWAEDGGRIKSLEKAGFRVIVVWDFETNEETIEKIVQEISK